MGATNSKEESWGQTPSSASTSSSSWDAYYGYLQSTIGAYPPSTYGQESSSSNNLEQQNYSIPYYAPSVAAPAPQEYVAPKSRLDKKFSRITDNYNPLDEVINHRILSVIKDALDAAVEFFNLPIISSSITLSRSQTESTCGLQIPQVTGKK